MATRPTAHDKKSARSRTSQRSQHAKEGHDGKRRRPHKSRAALVESIASALVIKDEDIFFLCAENGELPLKGPHGYGLYYHDCRFLNGYEVRLAGAPLRGLTSTADAGFKADFELTNIDTRLVDGRTMPQEELGVHWERVVDGAQLALKDEFTFDNFGMEEYAFPLSFTFAAGFEDVFVVRGMPAKARGTLHAPHWEGDTLILSYDGSDHVYRQVTVTFDPAPIRHDHAGANLQMKVAAHAHAKQTVTLTLTESTEKLNVPEKRPRKQQTKQDLDQKAQTWLQQQTECRTANPILNEVLRRGLLDLHMLRARLHGTEYFSAGVPWYVTLFGRDSLIAALEALAFEPNIAEQTLRLLARYQGTKTNEFRDEEPGKIMHELRVGELAHDNEIPQTPYYGSVDSTPLFLILMGVHAQWTGRLDVFNELRDNVARALTWIDDYGTRDDGFLAYESKASKGLGNQGWKDSGDAIVNRDGTLAEPPIALPEVQGYVFLAKTLIADLYRRAGDPERAAAFGEEARQLRQRFNRAFWIDEIGAYALALQKDGRPAQAVASNAGQVLWSGIADQAKAGQTVKRLMAEDMFSGWGIRTLSTDEKRYNPIAYHLGSVWPHDNALIMAGFRRYGFDDAAATVFSGIVQAGSTYRMYRLPEVFCGFPKKEFDLPVRYPVACHPQAWAAGAVPYMLTALLGLAPEAFEGRLRIVRPHLPDDCGSLELHRLRVGQARIDLRFARADGGKVSVEVLGKQGALEVITEG